MDDLIDLDNRVSTSLARDALLMTMKQGLECVVCKDEIIMGGLLTLCCCGQRVCVNCKSRLVACPLCRGLNINTVKDVNVAELQRVMGTLSIVNTDLPDI